MASEDRTAVIRLEMMWRALHVDDVAARSGGFSSVRMMSAHRISAGGSAPCVRFSIFPFSPVYVHIRGGETSEADF